MVGVAGAATRAALTLHQARRDNMADVAAKDGSQVNKVPTENIKRAYFIPLHDKDLPQLVSRWSLAYSPLLPSAGLQE